MIDLVIGLALVLGGALLVFGFASRTKAARHVWGELDSADVASAVRRSPYRSRRRRPLSVRRGVANPTKVHAK